MIVCHCHAISDREIRDAARRGARTRRDLGSDCPAGGSCGGCSRLVEEILATASRSRDLTGQSRGSNQDERRPA